MADETKPKSPVRFSKRRRTFQFEVEEADGRINNYQLIAIDGPGREAFMDFWAQRMKFDDKGKQINQVPSMIGLFRELLSISVYTCDQPPQLVPWAEVGSWPGEVQQELFDMAKTISALDRKGEEEVKND